MDLKKIEDLPNGARFYRCAFQVNTYDYIVRHKHPTVYTDEASYNAALIQSCKDNGIEIIGLADHYRIRSAAKLIGAAQAAGIIVFPGFEAVSKEGVHFLCLFDPSTTIDAVQVGEIKGSDPLNDSAVGPLSLCGLRGPCDEVIGSF